MGFSSPLGLLALLAIPAILYLHLFRRRFNERRVSALFLFAADALPAAAGRTRARLLRTPSLWCELLAALFLALWLGGLHIGAPGAERHLVLVLDDSASMSARGPLGDTLERARAWVGQRLSALPASAEVTLIRTGARPEVLAGPRGSPAEAREALQAWTPSRPSHDPTRAWELGLDLAGQEGELTYLTDRDDILPPPRYRHLAFGESIENVAVVSARRVLRKDEERVFVDLIAWGEQPIRTEVRLEAVLDENNTREIVRKTLLVTPGRTLHLAWSVPATRAALRIRLQEDALATDNVAILLPEPRRIVPVFADFDEQALLALRLERVLRVLPAVQRVSEVAQARLVLASRAGLAHAGATEMIIAAGGALRDAWVGPFLLERRRVLAGGVGTPLLSGLSLEGVVWSAGRLNPPGLPLILAGEQVLLAEESVGGAVRLHCNLDPRRSNLSASPDWPILLSNLVEYVRSTLPGPLAVNVRVGGEMALRFEGTPEQVRGLSLFDPRGAGIRARGWRLLTFEARHVGIHTLKSDGRAVARFAVNFVDPSESDLGPRGEVDTPAVEAEAMVRASLGAPGGLEGRILALLLLLAILADWLVLGRRR